jgi:hypothetical protein
LDIRPTYEIVPMQIAPGSPAAAVQQTYLKAAEMLKSFSVEELDLVVEFVLDAAMPDEQDPPEHHRAAAQRLVGILIRGAPRQTVVHLPHALATRFRELDIVTVEEQAEDEEEQEQIDVEERVLQQLLRHLKLGRLAPGPGARQPGGGRRAHVCLGRGNRGGRDDQPPEEGVRRDGGRGGGRLRAVRMIGRA